MSDLDARGIRAVHSLLGGSRFAPDCSGGDAPEWMSAAVCTVNVRCPVIVANFHGPSWQCVLRANHPGSHSPDARRLGHALRDERTADVTAGRTR